jgi:hypothetical protein
MAGARLDNEMQLSGSGGGCWSSRERRALLNGTLQMKPIPASPFVFQVPPGPPTGVAAKGRGEATGKEMRARADGGEWMKHKGN